MKIFLLLAVLATAATAQNSFQNTRFDIPVDLPVEDPSVLAQIEGVPNHHVKNELKPVKIKKTINEVDRQPAVVAPQPALPQVAQPQPAQVAVAPTPAPLFPGFPQFQLPGFPALTLPGFAAPAHQGSALPAPPVNAPVPTADDYDQPMDIPTAIKPTTKGPGNRKNKHQNNQPTTATSQPAAPTTVAPLVLVQSQGPSTLPPTFGQQPNNNQFYQQYNQQYQQYQQQYQQQQQQLQNQFGQPAQPAQPAQIPTFGQQNVQIFGQQPVAPQQQNFQQRPTSFQSQTIPQTQPQLFQQPQGQLQQTFITNPPTAPAVTPLPAPSVQQPPFAQIPVQFGAPTQLNLNPAINQQLAVSPPQFSENPTVVQPAGAVQKLVKPIENVDYGTAITPSRASIWFKEQTDLTSCRADLNNIAEKFKNKFPVYLRNGGKDADLAELVQQRINECEKKSSAGHWEKVDGLLTKISLSKSEEDECRAGLVQERISCDNLMNYTCQFIAPAYPFRLVPARITIQEARQAESGAEKCRKVVRLVKKRLEG
ncbi:unnamed protein product [Auanema sp. JU1783]|nr:unnamed protein product [Auanema sp. JU1783]